MKWTLSELRRYADEPMHLQKQLELNDAMKARFPDQILAVAPVKIDGSVMRRSLRPLKRRSRSHQRVR